MPGILWFALRRPQSLGRWYAAVIGALLVLVGAVPALFDGSPQSPKGSDHDGLGVVYDLSWEAKGLLGK